MIKLEEILEIPTFTGSEDMMVEFIRDFCIKNNFDHYLDKKNNIYITKGVVGEEEYYPCLVAHTDTVHRDQEDLLLNGEKITIKNLLTSEGKTKLMGWNSLRDVPTGIGGDDKCGIYICLKMLLELDQVKVAFFVEEETGMHGSKVADKEFFNNVGYAIQFDAPTANWFSQTLLGEKLWTNEFFDDVRPVLENNNIDNISKDPFTDVYQIRKKFNICCAVFPTGYYNQHSVREYVVPEETEKCIQVGLEAVKKLGNKRFLYS